MVVRGRSLGRGRVEVGVMRRVMESIPSGAIIWVVFLVIIFLMGHFRREWRCQKWISVGSWYILMAIIILRDGEFATTQAAMALYIITGIVTVFYFASNVLENISLKKGDLSLDLKVKEESAKGDLCKGGGSEDVGGSVGASLGEGSLHEG